MRATRSTSKREQRRKCVLTLDLTLFPLPANHMIGSPHMDYPSSESDSYGVDEDISSWR